MQKLAEICIRRPIFASMIILSLVVVGAVSYGQLGVDRFPPVDLPTVMVRAALPGASPEEMESEVGIPLEEAVNTVQGITELRTIAGQGTAIVVVTFALDRDIDVGHPGRARPRGRRSAEHAARHRPAAGPEVRQRQLVGDHGGAHGRPLGARADRDRGQDGAAVPGARLGRGRRDGGRRPRARDRRAHRRGPARRVPHPDRGGADGTPAPERRDPRRQRRRGPARDLAAGRSAATTTRAPSRTWWWRPSTARRFASATSARSRTAPRSSARSRASTACPPSASRCGARRAPTPSP